MYFATSGDEVQWTLESLVGFPSDLRIRLGQWLARRQGTDVSGDRTKPLELVDCPVIEARLLQTFISAPTPGDGALPVTEETIAALPQTRDACVVRAKLEKIHAATQLVARSEIGKTFETVINRIFVVDLPNEIGGSSQKSVGTIWSNPPASASAWDVAELLVHELTHQLLFLDEQVHGHYTDRVGAQSGSNGFLVKSTIRRAKRPLGAVFHSLAVALELCAFRENHDVTPTVHGSTDSLLAAAEDTIRSIVWQPDWAQQFRTRGRFLFERYRALWERLVANQPGVISKLLQAD